MNQTHSILPALEVARLACKALDDKKAEAIRVLEVGAQSSITDYLVLATGTSEPHLRALRVELEKVLDAARVRILGMDTNQGSGWLVVDAFDVMVHLFTPQTRETYKLETLWKDAVDLPVEDLLAGREPKPVEKVVKVKKITPARAGLKPVGKKKPTAKAKAKAKALRQAKAAAKGKAAGKSKAAGKAKKSPPRKGAKTKTPSGKKTQK